MREKIISGRTALTLVVKRVKGRLYVYDEFRLNGRVITRYIGPLEEMARVYQVYKSLGKVERLSRRDLRRMAKYIVSELEKKLSVVNSSRDGSKTNSRLVRRPGFEPGISGLGGRRPVETRQKQYTAELTTPRPVLPMPPVDNQRLTMFNDWLQGQVTANTTRDYLSVIRRGIWPPERRSHIKAWRKYIHFLFSTGSLSWEQYQAYLAFLRLPKQARVIQVEVPVKNILEYRRILEAAGYGWLYKILLGGARLSHIMLMLRTWRPMEKVRHPTGRYEPRLFVTENWMRYYLGEEHGNKRCLYIYFPAVEIIRPEINYRQLKDRLRKLGVQAKLFRKFANQKLEELAHSNNIPLDAVSLIMSRELSITGGHYLNTRDWADKLFSLYVKWLRERGLL